jgi:hypothetical protein
MTSKRPIGKRETSHHAAAIVGCFVIHLERARDHECDLQPAWFTDYWRGMRLCRGEGGGSLERGISPLAALNTQKWHQKQVVPHTYGHKIRENALFSTKLLDTIKMVWSHR